MDFHIEYRVKADQVDAQLAAIGDFIEAIRGDGDPEVRYTVYRMEDGVTFRHHAWMASEEAFARFRGRPQFKTFGEGTPGRCEEGPNVTKLEMFATSAE
jgi:quinol monooxygenase YgiN